MGQWVFFQRESWRSRRVFGCVGLGVGLSSRLTSTAAAGGSMRGGDALVINEEDATSRSGDSH